LSDNIIRLHYVIFADDFAAAGEASSNVKKKLTQLGINPSIIKKAAVSMYEAEMNAFIHANGGEVDVEISSEKINIKISDKGPGIPDIELAMQEGYSTAPDKVREMGFGAGMGLPNMRRHSDNLDILTEVGKGTTVRMEIFIK
jgi:anti-sigma regulatory factor (Ser/Thr protein kinase)